MKSHYNDISFMHLPKSYQEYFIRFYYYNVTVQKEIHPTIPVENIEEFLMRHLTSEHIWSAKGFAAARNCDNSGDNNDFNGLAEFMMVCNYLARRWYDWAITNGLVSEDEFDEKTFYSLCPFVKGVGISI